MLIILHIFFATRAVLKIGKYYTIIRCGFCDIQNNQGRGRGYQPKQKAEDGNPYRDLLFGISRKPI